MSDIDPVELHIKLKEEGWVKSPDIFNDIMERIIRIEKAVLLMAERLDIHAFNLERQVKEVLWK